MNKFIPIPLISIMLLFFISSCNRDTPPEMIPAGIVTPTKIDLTFSNGDSVNVTQQDSCDYLGWRNWTLIPNPDSIFYSCHVAMPENLEEKLNLHLNIFGFDYKENQLGIYDDYDILWHNIMVNDPTLINREPYKLNFFIEYYNDEGLKYSNTNNGVGIHGGFGFPYSTDQGDLTLNNVSFTETDFHLVCRDDMRTIRMQADLSGFIFDRLNTDTIEVDGSIDINLGGELN